MLDWTLFNLPDPEFMANIGEPPEPIIPSADRVSRPFYGWYSPHEPQDAENNSEDDDVHGIEPHQRECQPAINDEGTVVNGIWATVNDRVLFKNNGQAVNNRNLPKVTDGNEPKEAMNEGNWPKETVNCGKWPKNPVRNGNWHVNHAEHHADDGNWANKIKAAFNGGNRRSSNSEGSMNAANWPKYAVNYENLPKRAANFGNWPKNPLNGENRREHNAHNMLLDDGNWAKSPLNEENWQESNAHMLLNDGNWAKHVRENDAMDAENAETPEDGLPENHALPAAYMMWRDLARFMTKRASQWKDAEFQFRKQRAAILYDIQIENVQKALLETALEEIHREDELLEMDRLIRRHARHGLH